MGIALLRAGAEIAAPMGVGHAAGHPLIEAGEMKHVTRSPIWCLVSAALVATTTIVPPASDGEALRTRYANEYPLATTDRLFNVCKKNGSSTQYCECYMDELAK